MSCKGSVLLARQCSIFIFTKLYAKSENIWVKSNPNAYGQPDCKISVFFLRLPFSFSTCHFKHVPVKNLPCRSLGSMNHCSNIKEFVAQYCRGWNITWALYHVNACNNVALIVVSLCIKLRSGKISKDSFSRRIIGGSLSGTRLTNRRQCVCKLFIRWFQAMP